MEFDKNDPMYLRQIIMDHYSEPRQKGLTKKPTNLYIHQASESCIDDIHLELGVINNKIVDARFDGIGCAISTSSTDIMACEIKGKDIKMACKIIDNYLNMIFEKSFDENELNELIAFINVPKQPNRIKCATIGINGYQNLLKELIIVKK